MARIRTIKPEFFRHEGLQDLAIQHGAEVMLVFAGLWGHCDKLGRFEWKPRTLKLDILPFLGFDMAVILEILWQSGFLRRYEVDGREYGEIESFDRHQRISGKEATEPEKHPDPPEYKLRSNGEATGKQLGEQEREEEGKGREGKGTGRGKGREEEGNRENDALRARRESVDTVFAFWKSTMRHERAVLDIKRRRVIEARLKDGYTAESLCEAIHGCSLSPFHMGDNDRKTRYDGLDLILRDAEKVDKFIGYAKSPPAVATASQKFDPIRYVNDPAYAREVDGNKSEGGDHGRVIDAQAERVA